jgi:hypothetical protein
MPRNARWAEPEPLPIAQVVRRGGLRYRATVRAYEYGRRCKLLWHFYSFEIIGAALTAVVLAVRA